MLYNPIGVSTPFAREKHVPQRKGFNTTAAMKGS